MHLALFTDPTRQMEPPRNGRSLLLYAGQRKRKTFDRTMDVSNANRVTLYVFEKNSKTKTWEFAGNARVIRNVSSRTENDPPVWELRLFEEGSSHAAANKRDLFEQMGLVPKYTNLALGMIPINDS
jgi:hypothetical protein